MLVWSGISKAGQGQGELRDSVNTHPLSRSVIFYPFSDLSLIYFDFISNVSSPRPRL